MSKRREWWTDGYELSEDPSAFGKDDYVIHVREVRPEDDRAERIAQKQLAGMREVIERLEKRLREALESDDANT